MKPVLIVAGLLLAILALILGYRWVVVDPLISLTEEPIELEIRSNSHFVKAVPLSRDSAILKTIEVILRDKRGKWRRSIITYAPVTLFRGKTFTINFQATDVIINFTDRAGKPVQVVSSLKKQEFAEIQRLIAEAGDRPKDK